MDVRKAAAGLGALTVLLAVAFAPTASAGGPQPLPPAQAEALANTPAVQGPAVTRAVSPQEFLAAAAAPGAVVSVAPGLTLEQAVGLAPALSSSAGTSAVLRPAGPAAAAVGCSATAIATSWGTWPYDQHVTDTTYWCAVYGTRITAYSTTANGTGTLCGTEWTTSQLISGGIGYSWFVLRSSAGFSCPTVIPWVTLHPSHHEDVSRNAWGSTAIVAYG